ATFFTRWLETGMHNKGLMAMFIIAAMLPAFYRYGYYPLIFIFPFCLITIAWLKKEKRYVTPAILIGLLLAGFIACYTYYQMYLNGQGALISEGRHAQDKTFLHFSNLRFAKPFLFNSRFNDSFIMNRFDGGLLAAYNAIKLFITLALLTFVFRVSLRNIRNRQVDYLNILTVCTILVNVLFLVAMSIKYKLDTNEDNSWQWTYVREFRYYSPAYFMTFLMLAYNYANFNTTGKRIVQFVVAPLVAIGICYSLYTALSGNPIGTFTHNHKSFINKREELKRHKKEGALVIVNGWSRDLDNTAYGSLIQLEGFKVYNDFGTGKLSTAIIAE